ncbi:MAG: SIS domain-containing protein [Candidatus Roizmanbacteria bacterium]
MIDLNNREEIVKTHKGDEVIISIDSLSKQLEHSFTEASKIIFSDEYKNISNIIVAGMGGSRFPALIIKELFKQEISVPIVINDDYHLPGFVNSNTLVILSSYSGTTEEVIAMGKQALEKNAKLAGICAGGEIESFLNNLSATTYIFDPIYNPSKQPRIGFGYAIGGLLGILTQLEVIKIEPQEIRKAIDALPQLIEEFKINTPKEINLAKQLAEQLYQKYPYYIVSEFLTGVGNAIQNQTNETAKQIASFRIIPELNHHLMEGLQYPDSLKEIGIFVFFYSKHYSPSIQKRFRITKDVVEKNNLKTIWYELKGANSIETTFELMALGSYLSMYLASIYGVDPSDIPYVNYFKDQLKK